MTALDKDLGSALEHVEGNGAALITGAVDGAFLTRLQAEIARVPFEPMAATQGRARQGGEAFAIPESSFGDYPLIRQLGDELTQRVHAAGAAIEGCARWRPNIVHVQQYRPGDVGITPHLDFKWYSYLVAVFTAAGEAPFTICRNREGDALYAWTASAGSLVLLRGPGFGGITDGRPLHMVRGPEAGSRISVSYRMNTQPTERT